ncbi:hypothetical protein AB0C02_30885, partial [Micromonospora sp. NPDC048999]|uniref:hypothetical protein n=1 Tax=Micromonospora sp. NPDC048999 TaxID=3155391 RepID=UPI0033FBF853
MRAAHLSGGDGCLQRCDGATRPGHAGRGAQIAQQEAEFQRAEREGRVSLLDILLQVGVGMLLDLIGYTSLQGCLGGSLWDCADLASNA